MSGEFEGRDVVNQVLILTGTGDGLSQAMAVKPGEHHMGDSVDLLIRATVHKVRFDPTKDDAGELTRVEIMRAETITIVESEFAQERIAAQEEANDAAAAKAKLPFGKDVDNPDDWEDAVPDQPTPADIADVADSTYAAIAALLPSIVDVGRLRRLRVAEQQTHAPGRRVQVLRAIDARLAELAGGG